MRILTAVVAMASGFIVLLGYFFPLDALTLYNEQNFEQAQVLFKQCLENNPQDSVGQLFLSRIISQ